MKTKNQTGEQPQVATSAGFGVWQPITIAPKDGTKIDIWLAGARWTDCYYGRPQHSCGEMGQYCDCCPSYDGWVDGMMGYLTGEDGCYDTEPTHWMLAPPPPNDPSSATTPSKP